MRCLFAALLASLLIVSPLTSARPARAGNCTFSDGFKALHDMIPATVGDCLVDEHYDLFSGNSLQETTGPTGAGGVLVWRKADNWTAFTDGYRAGINGPFGLQERLNTERFVWETEPPPVDLPVAMPLMADVLPLAPDLTFGDIDGKAHLVAQDGTYLGLVSSNQSDPNSICNRFGKFANDDASTNVRNISGDYGIPTGYYSVNNRTAPKPPMVIYDDRVVGFVTNNIHIVGGIDPDVFFSILNC